MTSEYKKWKEQLRVNFIEKAMKPPSSNVVESDVAMGIVCKAILAATLLLREEHNPSAGYIQPEHADLIPNAIPLLLAAMEVLGGDVEITKRE